MSLKGEIIVIDHHSPGQPGNQMVNTPRRRILTPAPVTCANRSRPRAPHGSSTQPFKAPVYFLILNSSSNLSAVGQYRYARGTDERMRIARKNRAWDGGTAVHPQATPLHPFEVQSSKFNCSKVQKFNIPNLTKSTKSRQIVVNRTQNRPERSKSQLHLLSLNYAKLQFASFPPHDYSSSPFLPLSLFRVLSHPLPDATAL